MTKAGLLLFSLADMRAMKTETGALLILMRFGSWRLSMPIRNKNTPPTEYEMVAGVIKEFLPKWGEQGDVDLDYGNLQSFAARVIDAYKTRYVVSNGVCL
jgi:hypothetical protein